MCDSKGAIYKGRKEGMNTFKQQMAEKTNAQNKQGKLKDVIEGADIFIGVSQEKALRGHWAAKMAKKAIIFALANPIP
jgi:malate dehydrogenase (oxaloacetate-decarboxylating)